MRIERFLDVAERRVDGWPKHLLVPLAAGQAVAVLAAERAAELQHQVGHLLGDAPHAGHIAGVLQVEERPNVQTADAGMAVEGAIGALAIEDFAESGGELRQTLRARRPRPR